MEEVLAVLLSKELRFRESEIFFAPSNFYMPEKSVIATIKEAYMQIRLVSIRRITRVFQNQPFPASGTLKRNLPLV